jgi:origin recognition complex subunit 5
MPQNVDVFTQIATLSSLRLLLRAGTTVTDALDPGCKWRVNCGWEYIATLGRSVGLEMRDLFAVNQD